MTTPTFNNGDKVKDKITGCTGIIVATSTWLNGCIRYIVQPQELKEGHPVETAVFDQGDLILVDVEVVKGVEVRETGGPQRGEKLSR